MTFVKYIRGVSEDASLKTRNIFKNLHSTTETYKVCKEVL